jgi:D-alanine-D-alanine ligase
MNNRRRKAATRESSSTPAELDTEPEEPPSPTTMTTSLPARSSRSSSVASYEQLEITFPSQVASEIRIRPRTATRRRPLHITDLSQVEVVVLYSTAQSLQRGRPEELIADQETAQVAHRVTEALEGEVGSVQALAVWDDLPAVLGSLDPARHVVFNLVEGLGGRAFTEPEAVRQIEAMGFRHTGVPSRPMRLTSSKLSTKRILLSAGLPTPPFQVFDSIGDAAIDSPWPAIVKPVAEGGSIGITQNSVVQDPRAARHKIAEALEVYQQPAMLEAFIPGRELNVALWGGGRPELLPISEIIFEWTDDPLHKVVSFDAKWNTDSVEYYQTPGQCPAALARAEQARVELVAKQVHKVLGLRGYVRIDMRLLDGIPYVLEVNSNPDLAPEAGFYRSARAAGHSYRSMILHILKLALVSPR